MSSNKEYFNIVKKEIVNELSFKGASAEIVDLLDKFEHMCLVNALSPAEHLQAMCACLKGEAAQWFRENHFKTTLQKCIDGERKVPDANGIVTPEFTWQEWQHFVDSFRTRFFRKLNNCSTSHPYFSCRKGADESWSDYASTVGLLIESFARQSDVPPPELHMKIFLTYIKLFSEEMPEYIRFHLDSKHADDWSDFLRLIEIEEDRLKDLDQRYLRCSGKGKYRKNRKQRHQRQ